VYKLKQINDDFIVTEDSNVIINEKGSYNYYLLTKKNYNTESVIQELSKKSNIPRKFFSYAGLKDKNAITKQYISVKGTIKEFENDNYSIKHIGKSDKPISLGDLKGNKFEIVIRNIESNSNYQINKSKLIDFTINYFDEQRFSKNNFEIGLSIIKKDYKRASELIDYDSCQNFLIKNPTDLIGAIRTVPFKILKIYISAVQSFFWNEVTKEYIKKHTKINQKLDYSLSEFIFTNEKIKNIEIPLITFDTEFENSEIEDSYIDILKKYNITPRDFIIRTIPNITPKGNVRNLICEIKNLQMSELQIDELNDKKKKVNISFELGKGSYATIIVKHLFSNAF
jgi:tRNA pseudouridine13 synthase